MKYDSASCSNATITEEILNLWVVFCFIFLASYIDKQYFGLSLQFVIFLENC